MRFADEVECVRCHGTGEQAEAVQCARCAGRGWSINCWATRPGQRNAHDLATCSHYVALDPS